MPQPAETERVDGLLLPPGQPTADVRGAIGRTVGRASGRLPGRLRLRLFRAVRPQTRLRPMRRAVPPRRLHRRLRHRDAVRRREVQPGHHDDGWVV